MPINPAIYGFDFRALKRVSLPEEPEAPASPLLSAVGVFVASPADGAAGPSAEGASGSL